MPHLFLLGAHIFFVGGAATHLNGLTADDFDPVAFQTDDLARVVGHDAELADAQIKEYLRADAVIAEVRLEAELFVGFNGVVALILKGIGLQLVGEANAPAFLTHVDDRAPAFLFDAGQRGGKLVAAVAAQGTEHISSKAF